jgi:hypothetical protein
MCVPASVLQVIEANDATRMLYCHDGTHTVVVHLPPQALGRYRVGLTGTQASSSGGRGGGGGGSKASAGAGLSGWPLASAAAAPAALTLNRLGARRCLVAVQAWHWSTAVVCGAWMRGSVREAGAEVLGKSKPFCIQVRVQFLMW